MKKKLNFCTYVSFFLHKTDLVVVIILNLLNLHLGSISMWRSTKHTLVVWFDCKVRTNSRGAQRNINMYNIFPAGSGSYIIMTHFVSHMVFSYYPERIHCNVLIAFYRTTRLVFFQTWSKKKKGKKVFNHSWQNLAEFIRNKSQFNHRISFCFWMREIYVRAEIRAVTANRVWLENMCVHR